VAQKDAWRAYVELALGLTDTSRKKAMKIVQQVAGKGGATAEQLQELVNQGLANREAMTRMIRVELDRALGRVGLATMDEVEELNRRVRDLERELNVARGGSVGTAHGGSNGAVTAPAKKTAAKKTVAKKTVAKKTATKAAATTGTAPASVGSGSTATAPAKKTAAARKTAATRTAPAKKTTAATKKTATKTAAGTRTAGTRTTGTRTAGTRTAGTRTTGSRTRATATKTAASGGTTGTSAGTSS